MILDKHQTLACNNIDLLREELGRLYSDSQLQLLKSSQQCQARICATQIGSIGLINNTFGEQTNIRINTFKAPPVDSWFINFPIQGYASIRHRSQQLELSPQQGAFIDGEVGFCGDYQGYETLSLIVNKQQLNEFLCHYSGLEHTGFHPSTIIDFIQTPGRNLYNGLKSIARQLNKETTGIFSEENHQQLQEYLLGSLLSHLPGYAVQNFNNLQQVLPAYAKRACDYIHAHYQQTISLAILADVAGCSIRNLQLSFAKYLQTSPLQYLKTIRLQHAHQRLKYNINDDTIQNIARQSGFSHMGNFCRYYQQVYGHTPSQDLRGPLLRLSARHTVV